MTFTLYSELNYLCKYITIYYEVTTHGRVEQFVNVNVILLLQQNIYTQGLKLRKLVLICYCFLMLNNVVCCLFGKFNVLEKRKEGQVSCVDIWHEGFELNVERSLVQRFNLDRFSKVHLI